MQLIIAIIITQIGTLLALWIGYVIGSSTSDKPITFKFPTFKKKTQLGAISKESQRTIELKGTRRGEAERAMEETLDKII